MSFLGIKGRGNAKRIKELDEIGQRPDAIVETFQEHGINISERIVNCVLDGEYDELDRVALPKSAVADKKQQIDDVSCGIMPA